MGSRNPIIQDIISAPQGLHWQEVGVGSESWKSNLDNVLWDVLGSRDKELDDQGFPLRGRTGRSICDAEGGLWGKSPGHFSVKAVCLAHFLKILS